jgi:hypothetical protein
MPKLRLQSILPTRPVLPAHIVFVTHSDHIVRQLLPRSDCAIINIERPFARLRRIYTQKDLLKALDSTRDLAPYAAVNFLSSRRVLFVEGPTDEAIIQRAAIAHFAGAPDRLAQFDKWTLMPLGGVDNAPAPGLIERLFSSSLFPPSKKGEMMLVARIRDRDYDKTPCLDVHKGQQVSRLEKVWSRHSIESLWMDEDVLVSLLQTALGPAAAVGIPEMVIVALAEANIDGKLCVGAEDEYADYFRKSRTFLGKASQVQARSLVHAHPETWQRGKDRAEFVLHHIRLKLPLTLQNKVRGNIAKILEGIPQKNLNRVLVPFEIKTLLDKLVDL